MTAAILHKLGRANLSDATALMMAFGEGGAYGDSNFMPPMAGAGVRGYATAGLGGCSQGGGPRVMTGIRTTNLLSNARYARNFSRCNVKG